ncbi:hypothetical protein HK096_002571 [Nowakowskiella sp. JEL0078]|nr:hypothetical protein HK096_002571 [Nowakowskiella sp. JEL0078]
MSPDSVSNRRSPLPPASPISREDVAPWESLDVKDSADSPQSSLSLRATSSFSRLKSPLLRPGELFMTKATELLSSALSLVVLSFSTTFQPNYLHVARESELFDPVEYNKKCFVNILSSRDSQLFDTFKQFCVTEFCHENILCFISHIEIEEMLRNIPGYLKNCDQNAWVFHRFLKSSEKNLNEATQLNSPQHFRNKSLSRRSFNSPLEQLEATTEQMQELMYLLEENKQKVSSRRRSSVYLNGPVKERMRAWETVQPPNRLPNQTQSLGASMKIVPSEIIPHFLYFFTCFVDDKSDSLTEVNVSHKIKKKISDIMNSSEPLLYTIFDDVVDEVLQMLYLNTFRRFVTACNDGAFGSNVGFPRSVKTPKDSKVDPKNKLQKDSAVKRNAPLDDILLDIKEEDEEWSSMFDFNKNNIVKAPRKFLQNKTQFYPNLSLDSRSTTVSPSVFSEKYSPMLHAEPLTPAKIHSVSDWSDDIVSPRFDFFSDIPQPNEPSILKELTPHLLPLELPSKPVNHFKEDSFDATFTGYLVAAASEPSDDAPEGWTSLLGSVSGNQMNLEMDKWLMPEKFAPPLPPRKKLLPKQDNWDKTLPRLPRGR